MKHQKASLTRKMILNLLLIGFVPLFIFGTLTMLGSNRIWTTKTIDFQSQNIKQHGLYIDHIMSDISSLVANLSGIDEIVNALQQDPSRSAYDKLSTQAKIGYILNGYSNLDGLISIDIFSDSGVHYHVGETLNTSNTDLELRDRLKQETLQSTDYLNWSGIEKNINQDSKYPYVVMATKLLYIKGNIQPSGLLVISYDPTVFKSLSESLSTDAFSIVYDSKNRILYHPDQAFIGKTVSKSIIEKTQARSGNFMQAIDDKNMLVIYEKTFIGNWTVASFVPEKSINAQVHRITVLFAIMLFVAMLAVLFLGSRTTHQIVIPIRKIAETFKALKNGDLDRAERLKIKTKDEIAELGNLFNSFIDANEDITLQKKLERKLNEQNQELQDALGKLKETQAQIIQQEKLAGIGLLAGGVAHEINNPINGIMNYAQLIVDDTAQDHFSYEYANEILRESERVAVIVKNLLMFARQEKQSFELEHVPDIINETLSLIKTLIRHDQITTELDIAQNLPDVKCRKQQIQQVLMNLITNARDSLNQKYENFDVNKVIRISCGTYFDKEHSWVRICVTDYGVGIPESVMNRLFEPFFTTKLRGKGTGLGLSISHGIIKDHQGRLHFESQEYVYTSAYLDLPFDLDGEMVSPGELQK